MKVIFIRTVSIKILFTIIIFVFVRSQDDVLFVPTAMLIGNFIALVVTYYDLHKHYKIRLRMPSIPQAWKLVKLSTPFFVSRFASTFYQDLDVIVLGRIYGSSPVVGYYSSADKLIAVVKTGSSPLADSLYPYMLKNKNFRLVKKLLLIVMPVITVGVVLVGIFAEPLCVLLFEAEYRDAGKILRLLLPIAWVVLPSYIIAFPIMSPLGLVKYTNMSNVIGMFFQLIGFVVLYAIGRFNVYAICGLTSVTEMLVFLFRVIVVMVHLSKTKRVNYINQNIPFDYSNIKAFQGYLTNHDKLLKSSSGGVTRALSNAILSQGGVVFGVQYSADFYRASYCCISNKEDVDKIIGSKYIYTDKTIEYEGEKVPVYRAVETELLKGKYVLFFGLGCDVAAVKQYMTNRKTDISKLFLIDLICQGPTFPEVQESYLKRLEEKYSSSVKGFSVRYKLNGWSAPPYIRVQFQNGKEHVESFYGSDFGFAFSKYSRNGCFQCQFRGQNHKSDITIGDYWGIDNQSEGYNKDGVSIMLTASAKGEMLLNMIDKSEFIMRPADVVRAITHNPMYYSCRTPYHHMDRFKDRIASLGLHKAVVSEMGAAKYYYMRMRNAIGKILTCSGQVFL